MEVPPSSLDPQKLLPWILIHASAFYSIRWVGDSHPDNKATPGDFTRGLSVTGAEPCKTNIL